MGRPGQRQRVTGRLSALQGELDRFTELETRIDDLELMVELAQEEGDADAMAEAEAELQRLHKAVEQLEVRTLLSGEYDAREAIDQRSAPAPAASTPPTSPRC